MENFLVPYTSATISPCFMGTRTCFSVHSVVPSTLVELLRLLKSQCDGSGESRQKARRKLERGLMPNEQVMADAKHAF